MTLEREIQPNLLGAADLDQIESKWPEGIPSQEIVALFQTRGVKLSEATFRKYVQLGLLPTSRRVGQKGKHRGSRGLYPVTVVRRINLIKRMMAEGMTLEEILDSFLSIQNEMERVAEVLEGLMSAVNQRIERLRDRGEVVAPLSRELHSAKKVSANLLERFEVIQSRLATIGSQSIPTDQGGL